MEALLSLFTLIAFAVVLGLLALPFLIFSLFGRVRELRERVLSLELQQAGVAPEFAPATSPPSEPHTDSSAETVAPTRFEPPPIFDAPAEAPADAPAPVAYAQESAPPPRTGSSYWDKAKAWALGGNTLARLGVLVLFFGVAFLLKYAMEQGVVPIELRLAGTALGGVVLLVLGWRLGRRRRGYGLVLQGGGTGVVYLTVFSAVSLYGLLPPGAALLIMVALVGLSGALAVLQDARSLAVLAAVGGFLAPVLVSHGGGDHVLLFSYYLVLALGIFGIAWFKAWRELNLVGFGFIFVIGALWGYTNYEPAHYASTQPFLIAFFLLYALIPVLFARRQPPRLRGYVDGSLVFGVPLLAFALQATLVAHIEYGLAFSALAGGLFYAALGAQLWRRGDCSLRMLIEAQLAMAVALGTLAIPFALEGRHIGGAWALEGAALVWIGIRQRRVLARVAGLLIQLAAGFSFLLVMDAPRGDWPVLNSFYIGALLISLAGLYSAYFLWRGHDALGPYEREFSLARAALGWGVVWWAWAALREVLHFVPAGNTSAALLVVAGVSAAALGWLRRRYEWSDLSYTLMLLLPVLVLIAATQFFGSTVHPFSGFGLFAWALAVATFYWVLRAGEALWPAGMTDAQHVIGAWLLLLLLAWELSWILGWAVPESVTWSYVAWGLLPAAAVFALCRRDAWPWPVGARYALYLGPGMAPVVALLGLWCVHASFQVGGAQPLPTLPLLNPLELVQMFVLLTLLYWSVRTPLDVAPRMRWYALAAVAFVMVNGMIGRMVHAWAEVPFSVAALWASETFQASASIVWALIALAVTVLATRIKQREAWLAGAALIAAVVAKLFLVDLAGVGTLARIVSFISVGVLILVIAYLSPLPPRAQREFA